MFVQDVLCSGISCSTCYWCFDSDLPHIDCLRQMGSVSLDPRSFVCPLWLDNSTFDPPLSDIGIQDPTKSGELASA